MSKHGLPLKIAILGATSQIAKDLIVVFSNAGQNQLHLFARQPEIVQSWLSKVGICDSYAVNHFSQFKQGQYDAIINFVGVGDPAKAAIMGSSVLDVTYEYDTMVLEYLQQHPHARYIFMSSGAVYGASFEEPVNEDSKATIPINHIQPQDWYGVAKLYAECRHRSLTDKYIVDVRVFNYISHTQDLSARFLVTDILRAIRAKEILLTSPDNIVRDYIGSADLYQLIIKILTAQPVNDVVDCYTKSPIDKLTMLAEIQNEFGLRYQFTDVMAGVNATGLKSNYYSKNRHAETFGYSPSKTSLETIIEEFRKVLIRTI